MKIVTLATAIILGSTGTAAFAQAVNTGWYIAPTIAVVINDSARATNFGNAVGLHVGKALNQRWNIEMGGQYMRLDGSNDRQGNIGVDGLYFFNRNANFAPYAIGGLAYSREGASNGSRNENLLVKAGMGFTKQLNATMALRSDIRYQWHGNKAQASGVSDLSDWVVSVGLNVALGK